MTTTEALQQALEAMAAAEGRILHLATKQGVSKADQLTLARLHYAIRAAKWALGERP